MEGCLWRVVLSAAGMHRVDRDNVHDMAWSFVRLVVCGGGTHKCVLQPLQCWERSVAVSRHCGCARRALGADRDRDRTVCRPDVRISTCLLCGRYRYI